MMKHFSVFLLALSILCGCDAPVRQAVRAQLASFPEIPGLEGDLVRIDSLMSAGSLILHHSPEFGAAYHPHYRIIARELLATLPGLPEE